MGLATIYPHSHKVQSKLYKIPKFGHPDTVRHSVRMAIHFFVNYFDILIQSALYQSNLAWLTPNLGIFRISVCSFWLCGSYLQLVLFGLKSGNRQRFEPHSSATSASRSRVKREPGNENANVPIIMPKIPEIFGVTSPVVVHLFWSTDQNLSFHSILRNRSLHQEKMTS